MKNILLLCFLIISYSGAMSQDNIIMRNGDEIKAKVTEVTETVVKYRKWDYQEGPLYSILKNEVFMIVYENGTNDVFTVKEKIPQDIRYEQPAGIHFGPKEKGITGNFALGMNSGENTGISFLFAMSYIMKYHYSFGLGMGMEGFNNRAYLPVYLNFLYLPLKGNGSPYFYAMGGYSSPGNDNNRDYSGGIMAEAGMGLRGYIGPGAAFQFGIGFRYQESSFNYTSWTWINNQQVSYNVSGKDYFRRIPFRFAITVE